MDNVVDLFTGKAIPAAEESDFVTEFSEGPLGDFLYAVQRLTEATDEEEFRSEMRGIQEQVAKWPTRSGTS